MIRPGKGGAMIELLAPAGSYESLQAAVNAGADAVYIGGSRFGARAYADNPDETHLNLGIDYCHLHGRKIYMTVNTLLKEKELEEMLHSYLAPYYENGLDGVIVQDFGVMELIRQYFPGLELHSSTQMTVTSAEAAELLMDYGVTRVVPARELSLGEIRTIIEKTGIEVETFVHGAMCYCYSGQCLFSSLLGGRSGNRGRCAQPCRLPYTVEEQKRAGADRRNGEKKRMPYVLSMKDMCTLDLLPDLIDAGISSFKIEGRMKRPEYTAGVVSIYRNYIDRYCRDGRTAYHVEERDRRILLDLYNRGGFSDGYYKSANGKHMMAMERPNHLGTKAAVIRSVKAGKASAVAAEPLYKRDILEFSSGDETVLTEDVKEGSAFSVRQGKTKLAAGSVLFRTKSEKLLEELRTCYVTENTREKIKGDLKIFSDSPAILKVSWRDVSVSVSSDLAEPAKAAPASEEAVRRQMQKTGGTPFEFEELSIRLDQGLFIPVKALNELRRRGLEALTEEILKQAGKGRIAVPLQKRGRADTETGCSADVNSSRQPYRLSVLVSSWEQLDAVFETAASLTDTVYLDSILLGNAGEPEAAHSQMRAYLKKMKQYGIRRFLSCPPVFRGRDKELLSDAAVVSLLKEMDGFLLHTLDQMAFFRKLIRKYDFHAELAADSSLYAYNRRAQHFLRSLGADRLTLPEELNYRELGQLDCRGTELSVYGYQVLMQSAQCLVKNTKGCRKTPCILYLRDRKKAEFPVLNRCNVCCNTIYNSVPLKLCGCKKEILQLSPEYLRMSFTIESGRETARILKRYEGLLFSGADTEQTELDGTRGHFRRGVE